MYAMNRQLKSLKLFIEIIEKGHSIEFEFNGNHYKFSPVNDEYVLIIQLIINYISTQLKN